MASFTDAISSFNPYVQQLPVEAMVAVGMQKQQQYNEGVQKIQAYIDNIAGLDVIKPEHKQYLQSQLNDLGGKLKTVAAGDFSNQQLVNSVGGMATQIVKDPTIQRAVGSTQRIRNYMSEVEADKKAGTYNPANETVFNDEVNGWLSDGKIDTSFNGEYSKAFDWQKFTKEQFDAVKPGKYSFDQVFQTDANGNVQYKNITDDKGRVIGKRPIYSPAMKRLESEGRLPQEVMGTIGMIMSDPRVKKQLGIEGRYTYRGMNGEQLTKALGSQKGEILDNQYDQMMGLSLRKGAGEDVQSTIDELQLKIDNTRNHYDEYMKIASADPNAAKAKLYSDDITKNMTSMYGTVRNSTTFHDNPAANFEFKLTKEANDIKLAHQKMDQDAALAALSRQNSWNIAKLGRETQLTIASMKGGKGGQMVDTDGDGVPDTLMPPANGMGLTPEQGEQPSDFGVINKLETDYDNSAEKFNTTQDNLIWNGMFANSDSEVAKLNRMIANGIPKSQAIKTLIENAKPPGKTMEEFKSWWAYRGIQNIQKLSPAALQKNPDLVDAVNAYRTSAKDFSNVSTVRNTVLTTTANIVGQDAMKEATITNVKPVAGTYQGKKFTLTPTDQYDLALYLKGNQSVTGFLIDEGVRKAGDEAGRRLANKGYDFLLDHTLEYASGQPDLISSGQAITRAVRSGKSYVGSAIDYGRQLFGGESKYADVDLGFLKSIVPKLDSKVLGNVYKTQAGVIKDHYQIDPNLKLPLITGDAETDKNSIANIRRFAGNYATTGKNLSPDFEGFGTALADKDFFEKGGTVEAQIVIGKNNEPMVEIVAATPDGGRQGGMVVAPDEAMLRLGIDAGSLYQPKQTSIIKSKISQQGGKTSQGNPDVKQAYYNGDTEFKKSDFPNFVGAPNVDIEANLKYENGKYYGVFYYKDPNNNVIVRKTPGNPDLQKVIMRMKSLTVSDFNRQ
jgi:hypothetical protein